MANSPLHALDGDATLTIRIIKSFPYRNSKNLILHHVDLDKTTVGDLRARIKEEMSSKSGWKIFQNVALDTLKLYTQPQGTKTMNLIVNMEDDEKFMMVADGRSLKSYDCRNETEISFFGFKDYLAFKAKPEQKW